jgi:hypothetical protein
MSSAVGQRQDPDISDRPHSRYVTTLPGDILQVLARLEASWVPRPVKGRKFWRSPVHHRLRITDSQSLDRQCLPALRLRMGRAACVGWGQ